MKFGSQLIASLLCSSLFALPLAAEEEVAGEAEAAAEEDRLELDRRWTVITPPQNDDGEQPFESLPDLAFTGPNNDPNVIGEYEANGEWGVRSGVFQQVSGEGAAVRLGKAEDFTIEGIANLDGTGGWFLLLGWDGEHGHVVSHSSLRQNDYWRTYELKDGKANKFSVTTHSDSFRPRGEQPMWVIVKDGKLSLRVGQTVLLREHELNGYGEGDIILGSFKNQYGVKLIKFKALRLRALR